MRGFYIAQKSYSLTTQLSASEPPFTEEARSNGKIYYFIELYKLKLPYVHIGNG
jgi:hypothetical protein